MSKGYIKKCIENLKLVAPLMAIAFVVFGILGFGIWLLFHYTNIFIGFFATYIVCSIFVSAVFTYFVYDEESENKDNEDDTPNLPFMPGM